MCAQIGGMDLQTRSGDGCQQEPGRKVGEKYMYYCILTGGKSRRMGSDKAFLKLDGKYIVEVLIHRFMGEGRKLCVSSANGDVAGKLIHLRNRPLEVADIVREAGPMGGIYSLLEVLKEDIFVMATDMPFADVRLAGLIIAAARDEVMPAAPAGGVADPAALCLLERGNGRLEPLFGYYSLACLEPMAAMIAQGNYRLSALADRVHVRRIPETALAQAYGDGWERALFNMNTPRDYSRAVEIYMAGADGRNFVV